MKVKCIIATVLIGLSANVNANEICEGVAEYANSAMKARQNGVSILTLLGTLKEPRAKIEAEADGTEKEGRMTAIRVMERVITDAYDVPKWYGENLVRKAITEFEAEIYIKCVNEQRSRL